ncbi:Ref family protein [Escherichia coli]|nr:Ref family protein [Escherichia coli]
MKSRGLKGRTPTAEERTIANALGTLPCIACYMHGVISEVVSLHHISGRTAPGCHKKQLPLCRWHHQHAAPAEVREKYPWLVPVHADGVVGGKKEFTLLNKSEMELLAYAYEMANIMH